MMLDDVTRFQLDWQSAPVTACTGWASLNDWRTRFFDRKVIGQCENRYRGVGFGNVSCRLQRNEFLVSGTQTGHKEC